jgi:hypothetical protein
VSKMLSESWGMAAQRALDFLQRIRAAVQTHRQGEFSADLPEGAPPRQPPPWNLLGNAFSSDVAGDGPWESLGVPVRPISPPVLGSLPGRKFVMHSERRPVSPLVLRHPTPSVLKQSLGGTVRPISPPIRGSLPGRKFVMHSERRPVSPPVSFAPKLMDVLGQKRSVPPFLEIRSPAPPRRRSGADQGRLPSHSSFGMLPPVPSTHLLVGDILAQPSLVAQSPLLDLLLNDDSAQALRPSDPDLLEAYTSAVSHTVTADVKPGTKKKDRTGWNRWVQYMQQWNSDPLRDSDPRFAIRERFLKAGYLLWAKRRVKSTIAGRLSAKPATLMGDLYAVQRVHKQNERTFLITGMVHVVRHYLCTEYELLHGPESLVPQRREGFSRAHLRSMLACPSGLALRSRRFSSLEWDSWLGYNLAAALCLSSSGGLRKAELSLHAGVEFSAMHMSRASLFFVILGQICRFPSVEQVMGMVKGDQAGILASPSKADDLAMHFLPHPLFFNFDPEDLDNTALRLRSLYVHCPVPPARMRSTPLFSLSASGEPMRYDLLDLILKALLLTFMDSITASLYSWHSFRIGLACALRAAGAPDGIILALCRWRSLDSLNTYARINSSASGQWLDLVTHQFIDSIQGPNVARLSQPPPGMLPTAVSEFLSKAATAAESLSADAMRELGQTIPEIDDDKWMQELAALKIDSSSPADVDSDDEVGLVR